MTNAIKMRTFQQNKLWRDKAVHMMEAIRGGFYERKFVTVAEHPEGSYGVGYSLADPQKYLEIKCTGLT